MSKDNYIHSEVTREIIKTFYAVYNPLEYFQNY